MEKLNSNNLNSAVSGQLYVNNQGDLVMYEAKENKVQGSFPYPKLFLAAFLFWLSTWFLHPVCKQLFVLLDKESTSVVFKVCVYLIFLFTVNAALFCFIFQQSKHIKSIVK